MRTRILLLLATIGACETEAPPVDADAGKAQQDKAAEAKKQDEAEAKRRAQERKLEEENDERDYQDVKTKLEPFAKLPKKRPKGFASACAAMLEHYEAFMLKSLDGSALEKWQGDEKEGRLRVLRRECHKRAVEVVVCQTEVLKKAPVDVDVDHIMRLCSEKFGG